MRAASLLGFKMQPPFTSLNERRSILKAKDWSGVFVMCFVGAVCLYFAAQGVLVGEIICIGRGCSCSIPLASEPKMFYLSLSGLLFMACVMIGTSIRIVFSGKKR
jgi:hypothetical protein